MSSKLAAILLEEGLTKKGFGFGRKPAKIHILKDRISGLWSVEVQTDSRWADVTGDIFNSKAHAKKQSLIIEQMANAGASMEEIAQRYVNSQPDRSPY